ncbi:MAG: AAA family ATPase [Myxococcales bacterium]|nr:AAA family ATPase [Myxococcales bacterium]
MSDARLISVQVERFKSYEAPTRIELDPLTVILGRNNGGKSTLIQALLLLKQTLAHPRRDVPLHLEGPVDALTLRELTFGWPQEGERVEGPTIEVRWRSTVDVNAARGAAGWPDVANVVKHTGISWLTEQPATKTLETALHLFTEESQGRARTSRIELRSFDRDGSEHEVVVLRSDAGSSCRWDGQLTEDIEVEYDHFLPLLQLDRQGLGPRHRGRSWHTGFLLLFDQPLEDLKRILGGLQYLGSTRDLPPSVHRPASVPPDDLGVSGEYAAQLIHARQADLVHYLSPPRVTEAGVELESSVQARRFVDATNDVLEHLGVTARLRLEDVPNIGFRLLFGNASLTQVGRGLTYLLPIVELGLFADPLRFRGELGDQPLEDYRQACHGVTHIALEEPESHLHPKVQTRLAHWMVALAMSGRQLIVETHSDHLVRRLRGLMARAQPGDALEVWLRDSVSIVEVEQEQGRSRICASRLTPQGSVAEHWPADFMDEASDEERAIYYAGLDKPAEPAEERSPDLQIEHDMGPEPEPEDEP